MRRENNLRIRCTPKLEVLALLVLASAMLAPTASAAVIGHLTFDNCGSGGVIVTLTTIDFFLPMLGGNGCIMTGGGTNITYTRGGPLGPSDTGTVNDLGFTPTANFDFITFAGNPNLHFDLTGLGPGPINTACANSTNVNGLACSVVP